MALSIDPGTRNLIAISGYFAFLGTVLIVSISRFAIPKERRKGASPEMLKGLKTVRSWGALVFFLLAAFELCSINKSLNRLCFALLVAAVIAMLSLYAQLLWLAYRHHRTAK